MVGLMVGAGLDIFPKKQEGGSVLVYDRTTCWFTGWFKSRQKMFSSLFCLRCTTPLVQTRGEFTQLGVKPALATDAGCSHMWKNLP